MDVFSLGIQFSLDMLLYLTPSERFTSCKRINIIHEMFDKVRLNLSRVLDRNLVV